MSQYFKTLFKANDQDFQGYHLADIIGQYSINKLNTTEANALQGALTENECIDGFPSEFYKIFWKHLKSCVLKALNDSIDR